MKGVLIILSLLLVGCSPIDGYKNYNIFTGYETIGESND